MIHRHYRLLFRLVLVSTGRLLFGLVLVSTIFFLTAFAVVHANGKGEEDRIQKIEIRQDYAFLMFPGVVATVVWITSHLTLWGLEKREVKLKEKMAELITKSLKDGLEEVNGNIKTSIETNQRVNDLVLANNLSGMVAELDVIRRDQKELSRQLAEYARKMERMDGEVSRIEGNLDNLIPHLENSVNTALLKIGGEAIAVNIRRSRRGEGGD